MNRPPLLSLLRCGCQLAVLFCCTTTCLAEKWTDVSNTRTIEADFVGVWGNAVVLSIGEGETARRTAVPLTQLNAESRLRALKLQEERDEWRQRRVEEIKVATEAAIAEARALAPRPDVAYEPPPKDTDLATFIAQVTPQIKAGNLPVLWESLPESYRTDVESIVHQFAEKVDPEAWSSLIGVLSKVETLLTEKQKLIAGLPQVEANAREDGPAPETTIAALGEFADLMINPETLSKENLATIDIGQSLSSLGTELYEATYRAEHAFTRSNGVKLDELEVEVTEERGNRGVVQMTYADGTVEVVPFVRVEDSWIPEGLASDWPKFKSDAEEFLSKLGTDEDPMKSLPELVQPVNQFLDDLIAAENQTEFNGVIEALMAKIMGLMMGGAGGGFPFPGGAPGTGPGAGPGPNSEEGGFRFPGIQFPSDFAEPAETPPE